MPRKDRSGPAAAAYRDIVGTLGDDDRVIQGLRQGMDKNYFERRKSRVNRKLSEALGNGAATYLVQAFGRRPRTAYGLGLSNGQILVKNHPDRSKG